jgi:uncharacterized protein YjdB
MKSYDSGVRLASGECDSSLSGSTQKRDSIVCSTKRNLLFPNRSVNMYLNAIKMFNYSFFANAIVFATEEPTVTITDMSLDKTEVEVEADEEVTVKVTTTPFSANSPTITVASNATSVATASISGKTITIKGVASGVSSDGEATITVTAGNVTKTIAVTVPYHAE